MFSLGPMELTLIFLVVLLVFGGKKIPEVARGLGKGLREFKKAREDFQSALETEAPEPPVPAATAPTPKPPAAVADDNPKGSTETV